MKTIGLLGGMSWESTKTYYHLLNTVVKDALDGLHSAKIIVNSVDFAELEAAVGHKKSGSIVQRQHSRQWDT